jgi:hypothetical protein
VNLDEMSGDNATSLYMGPGVFQLCDEEGTHIRSLAMFCNISSIYQIFSLARGSLGVL